MAKNKLSAKKIDSSVITTLVKPEVLNNLSEKNQKVAIDAVKEAYSMEKEGGMLGKIFGTNKTNISIYIAFILCIILITVGFFIKDKDIWDKIFTIVAAVLGYIFGATQKEN